MGKLMEEFFAGCRVPHADLACFPRGGESITSRCKGDGEDWPTMAAQRPLRFAGPVPETNDTVRAGRGEHLAFRSECHGADSAGVGGENDRLTARFRVQDSHGPIGRACCQGSAVRRDGDGNHSGPAAQ